MSLTPFSFRTQPAAVKALMAAHAVVYVSQWFAWNTVVPLLGLSPLRVTGALWLWQPFTYLFLNEIGIFGFFFFLIDMYILASLGGDLARRWGSGAFAFYYFACGLAGAAVITAFGRFAPGVVLGGAVALLSLLAAFAAVAPGAEIVFYFLPMTARQMLLMLVVLEVLLTAARMMPLAEAAGHLAAMGVGYVLVRSRWLDKDWRRVWNDWRGRRQAHQKQLRVVSLEQEVDRILDKVLKEGSGSLTREEQELMQRYSKSKR